MEKVIINKVGESKDESQADPGKPESGRAAEKLVPSQALPAIPAKRYFTIGEVSELCGVKPYVLRYWEQEFTQLKPMKRRGNRRYYQHHEVLLIRRIRDLLYDQGFTISGARNRLTEAQQQHAEAANLADAAAMAVSEDAAQTETAEPTTAGDSGELLRPEVTECFGDTTLMHVRIELLAIRELLTEPVA